VIASPAFLQEFAAATNTRARLAELAAAGPEYVGLTCGSAGCLALVGEAIQHVPAFRVPVRDTTGAGDAFHAGYAFARARGDDWLDCLEFGSAVAALKCRDLGGRRALPCVTEVEALRATGARRSDRPAEYDH
jgi:sugar/nucleoside kinase (ribokinase family)